MLSPEQTIRDALNVINTEIALKMAAVVDDKGMLKGVVTDGDVRRGLLRNLALESAVTEIMNNSPVTAALDSDRKDLMAIMEEKGIFTIPLVDSNNVIVGIETYHHASTAPTPSYENPVFLMAGGFGTRLRPLTDTCPKPLLKVGGRPLLETVLLNFIDAGFKNFYISTHYLPEMLQDYFENGEKWDVNITYVHEVEPLGTGGALGLLPKNIPDLPILMMNGDVLTTVDFHRLLEFHIQNKADATMCVREFEYQVPYGVIMGKGHNIISMVEKPAHSFFVNAGIYVINSNIARSVESHQRIDMPTLLEQRLEKNEDVLMFPIHEYWLDIGRMDDFERAQEDYDSLGFPK